jgi:Holliday junction resolvase-like predicted endonuclease
MADQDGTYPGYGFKSHVGYGTSAHRQAIDTLGVTPLHRLSIAPLANYAGTLPPSVAESQLASGHTTKQIGDDSESAAARALESQGYRVIERNWKTKWCEIDIVCERRGKLYFVEVKHRKNDRAGDGFAAITPKKLRQMRYAADFYVHVNDLYGSERQLMAISTTGEPAVVTEMLQLS